LPPEKSRGSLSVREYKEARHEADRLEAENEQLKAENSAMANELAETKALLDEANRKKVKLMEIENIEVKQTFFGNKVTLPQEDFEKMRDLAEKEVVSIKQTKSLKAENKKLFDENAELKKTVKKQSDELAEYKKPVYFSRDGLNKQAKKIHEEETTKSKLNRAVSFIQACGLSDEFSRYRPNNKNKSYGLE